MESHLAMGSEPTAMERIDAVRSRMEEFCANPSAGRVFRDSATRKYVSGPARVITDAVLRGLKPPELKENVQAALNLQDGSWKENPTAVFRLVRAEASKWRLVEQAYSRRRGRAPKTTPGGKSGADPSTQEKSRLSAGTLTCWTCGATGHKSRACPSAGKGARGSGSAPSGVGPGKPAARQQSPRKRGLGAPQGKGTPAARESAQSKPASAPGAAVGGRAAVPAAEDTHDGCPATGGLPPNPISAGAAAPGRGGEGAAPVDAGAKVSSWRAVAPGGQPGDVAVDAADGTRLVDLSIPGAAHPTVCPVKAVLDSGAGLGTIPPSIARRMQDVFPDVAVVSDMTRAQPLRAVDGRELTVTEKTCSVRVALHTAWGPVVLDPQPLAVMPGTDDVMIIGKPMLKRLGIDVDAAAEASARARHDDRLEGVESPDVAAARRVALSIAAMQPPDREEVPDEALERLAARGPDMVMPPAQEEQGRSEALDAAVASAATAGLSDRGVDRLRGIVGQRWNAFRRALRAGDPPAAVEPMRVQRKPGARAVKARPRTYNPAKTAWMTTCLATLVAMGLLYLNKQAATMTELLDGLNCMVWVDDVIYWGHDEDDLLNTLELLLERLERAGLYAAAHKSIFFDMSITWCGKVYSRVEIKHDPERLSGLANVRRPETAGEMLLVDTAIEPDWTTLECFRANAWSHGVTLRRASLASQECIELVAHAKPEIIIGNACRRWKPSYETKYSSRRHSGGTLPWDLYELHSKQAKPWEVLQMDIQDMKVKSDLGNQYLLVVVDRASKFLAALPLPTKDALGVSSKLLELLLNFGLPLSIRSDMGSEYTARVMQHLCNWLKISLDYGPVNHPRAQGAVERLGGWLQEALSLLCTAWPRQWDKYVPVATWIHRVTPDTSLPGGVSPFQILFGRPPRSHIDFLVQPLDGTSFGHGLERTVEEQHHMTPEILAKRQEVLTKQRERHNARVARESPRAKAQVNDFVLVRETPVSLYRDSLHPKLAHDHFTGPWKVVNVLQERLCFTVQLNGRHIRQRRVVAADIKPFHQPPAHLRHDFEDEFSHLVWSSALDLADLSVASVPLYTLTARRVKHDRGGTAWSWEYRGRHHDGAQSDWITEDEARDSFSPLQLDVFHALWELYCPNEAPRPLGEPSRGEREVVSRELALEMFPPGTKVGRVFMDAEGRSKTFKATLYDYCDPYWRVEYPDGDWEELTKREVENGIGIVAQQSSSA
eukprot:g5333.t1